jgi:hypothetical protein
VNEVRAQLASDAVLLVDPAAGLVDPAIIDALIEHSRQREAIEICFTQAAPGLGGVLLRPKLLDQLAAAGVHPGRLLHYLPEQPVRDPIGGDGAFPFPRRSRARRITSSSTPIARSIASPAPPSTSTVSCFKVTPKSCCAGSTGRATWTRCRARSCWN